MDCWFGNWKEFSSRRNGAAAAAIVAAPVAHYPMRANARICLLPTMSQYESNMQSIQFAFLLYFLPGRFSCL
jgi:hypothetical protein